MKALSILQPWAWAIAQGYKDVENRRWPTKYRGWFLIHAGKTWSYEQDDDLAACMEQFPQLPWASTTFQRGGAIGIAQIVACVEQHNSRWFNGPYGFVIRSARPIEPFAYRGQLGWFDVPEISGPDDPQLRAPRPESAHVVLPQQLELR
ncbi:MAG TPA: ASCH domain-containing protein [Nevskia sp.]|nr:ASCH domain-containing protein [Nevskia sp.]